MPKVGREKISSCTAWARNWTTAICSCATITLAGRGIEVGTLTRYWIDAILVGPHGALVLEVKAYVGEYKVAGDRRFIRSGASRSWMEPAKNPMRQVLNNQRRVKGILATAGLGNVPVQPIVVAAHPRMNVSVDGHTAAYIFDTCNPASRVSHLVGGHGIMPETAARVESALMQPLFPSPASRVIYPRARRYRYGSGRRRR